MSVLCTPKMEKGVGRDEVKSIVDDQTAGIEERIEGVQAAGENTVALMSMAFRAQIVADRATEVNAISDEMILQSAALIDYPEYEDGHDYTIGEIIRHDGLLFEVIAAHTSNAVSYPVKTTFAYYRLIELEHTGALDDPIPYPEGAGIIVNVKNGLYYSYLGKLYLAKANMPNCVYPPDTPGMWQWEVVN